MKKLDLTIAIVLALVPGAAFGTGLGSGDIDWNWQIYYDGPHADRCEGGHSLQTSTETKEGQDAIEAETAVSPCLSAFVASMDEAIGDYRKDKELARKLTRKSKSRDHIEGVTIELAANYEGHGLTRCQDPTHGPTPLRDISLDLSIQLRDHETGKLVESKDENGNWSPIRASLMSLGADHHSGGALSESDCTIDKRALYRVLDGVANDDNHELHKKVDGYFVAREDRAFEQRRQAHRNSLFVKDKDAFRKQRERLYPVVPESPENPESPPPADYNLPR